MRSRSARLSSFASSSSSQHLFSLQNTPLSSTKHGKMTALHRTPRYPPPADLCLPPLFPHPSPFNPRLVHSPARRFHLRKGLLPQHRLRRHSLLRYASSIFSLPTPTLSLPLLTPLSNSSILTPPFASLPPSCSAQVPSLSASDTTRPPPPGGTTTTVASNGPSTSFKLLRDPIQTAPANPPCFPLRCPFSIRHKYDQ